MIKKLNFCGLLILFFLAFVPNNSDAIIITQQDSGLGRGIESAGNSFGGALANWRLRRQEQKALQSLLLAQIQQVYTRVSVIMQGYDKQRHLEYMEALAGSPDLSYSLKTGLIKALNGYRDERDTIDVYYCTQLKELDKKVSEEGNATPGLIISLGRHMDPNKEQKTLKGFIDQLNLDRCSLNQIQTLVKNYYQSRKEIDSKLIREEYALVTQLGG